MTDVGGLAVEILTRPEELAELEADWSRLWNAQARREVFTGFSWNLASWEASKGTSRLHLVVVRRAGAVVGILPLRADEAGARFLSGAGADYNDILAASDHASAIVETAVRGLLASAETGPCVLDNLPEWSVLHRSLEGLPADLRSHIDVVDRQPCPAIRLTQDRDGVFAAILGKQSLKRHEKKLARLGALALRHIEDRAAIHGLLPDFFAQHVARRALAGERSLFLDEASRSFYSRLVERLDPARELRFSVLEVGDRPVAYHLGFEVEGRFTWYKPTFDVDYWDYGAGEVLLKRLLEYVRDRPITEFDFTQGAESFKDRFSNHAGLNVRWTLHPSSASARVASTRRSARARLAANPRAAAIRRGLRSLPSRIRGLAQGAWLRHEWLVCSANPGMVASQPRVETGSASVVVKKGSLRDLAMLSVSGTPYLAPGDLTPARARLSRGDAVYLGYSEGSLVCLAWLATRSDIVAEWEGGAASRVDLAAPAAVIEVAEPSGVRTAPEIVATVIQEMARAAVGDVVWLLVGARTAASAQTFAGFVPRYRLGRSRLLYGRVRTWVTPLG